MTQYQTMLSFVVMAENVEKKVVPCVGFEWL